MHFYGVNGIAEIRNAGSADSSVSPHHGIAEGGEFLNGQPGAEHRPGGGRRGAGDASLNEGSPFYGAFPDYGVGSCESCALGIALYDSLQIRFVRQLDSSFFRSFDAEKIQCGYEREC